MSPVSLPSIAVVVVVSTVVVVVVVVNVVVVDVVVVDVVVVVVVFENPVCISRAIISKDKSVFSKRAECVQLNFDFLASTNQCWGS